MNFNQLFDDFEDLKVLILGDSMLDAYFYGSVNRISPEAPVPIVNLKSKERRLGGAANVALNIKAMGATPIMCTLKGNDRDGEYLKGLMKDHKLITDGLINDYNRPTTVKTRIIGNNHQMLRIDEEQTHPVDPHIENLLFEAVKSFIKEVDVLIMQDYNKGLLTSQLIENVIKLANKEGVKTVVDPKFNNFFEYRDVTLFKPNRNELKQAYNIKDHLDYKAMIKLAAKLRTEINAQKVMTTLSEDGVIIVNKNDHHHITAHERTVVDVSGAGDSVLSVAALCVALDTSDQVTAEMANLAGGLVCEKVGVVPIDRDTLLDQVLEVGISENLYRTDSNH
ncbi:D-glycero-beta-D-manno-heptose-7-phosphate kinase [bacterium]|nr:D-glycero-beta-D-manno-heptose-7-phosphate kinase [bacterium]